ncbi:MAG: Rieske (2Fe-2S) protein [Fimbriimonadaceae bacterium]|nr:Rieske (2Fe-2S) protein [Fimbriimonadaceae bacterium]QYK55527.1 MAG: Rieske (2Fe-2S) protein [Fimbriimonadaceae bacterium]
MTNQDSPNVENDRDDEMSRRGFVRVAVVGVSVAYLAALGYPIYRYLYSPVEKAQAMAAVTEISLEKADELPKGSAMIFKFGVRPALLIHHEDDSWIALDAVCTHMGCTVAYHPETQQIRCACHGGVYDAKTGHNVSGPPPRPLTAYKTDVQSGFVKVSRV